MLIELDIWCNQYSIMRIAWCCLKGFDLFFSAVCLLLVDPVYEDVVGSEGVRMYSRRAVNIAVIKLPHQDYVQTLRYKHIFGRSWSLSTQKGADEIKGFILN